MNRYNIFVKLLQDRISKPPVGIDGLAFSKNIVRKYGIFINSGRLPSLIFLRLFGGRRVNKNLSQETSHFVRSYLRNNFVKCLYVQYPDVFRQFCSYFPITDTNISQETANILIPEQGGIVNNTNIITNINNTIPYEYITKKYYETGDDISFPISTTTVRAPGITLHSINSIANNYLQRFINIKNTGPEFNKPIYPEIQYFANEKHLFRLLQIIKKNRPITDKNIFQNTANISIPEQDGIININNNITTNINNTIPREYITNKYYGTGDDISFPISTTTVRAPGITLHSINSIANNYLQRFINIRNTGPEFNKPIYPEIQYFANEKHLFRLLPIIKKNRPIADKNIFQNTANISIPEQGGIVNTNINTNINYTIPHEHITNKYYGTGDDILFPTSTTTVRTPGITLHSINSIANNYLQRFISIRNTGPEFNKPIYPEIQYFANEKHLFRLLQIIKKNRPITDKNIFQKTANISITEQSGIVNSNTIPYEYITKKYYGTGDDISFPTSTTTLRAPGITLHSINSIANNYLQRFINIGNTGPTFNKPIYPEIQYFANEKYLFRLLPIIKKNRPIADKKIAQETTNISIPEQDGIVNNNNNNNNITTNINNTIPREYITNKYYGTGDDISFPTSTMTVRAPGITLHSINSIANNYLQRFINIRNTGPAFSKAIYPEIQYFANEKHLFKLLQTTNKKRSIVGENISQDTVNISNSQQSRIANNTRLYDHIIKKSSKIINYLQEINNINNIGSRVIHPLVHGLHPSFNEEELINTKIFQIQDVDLTYASEPVLNVPTSQNADIVPKKIDNIPAESINSTKINESLIKDSPPHKQVHEIHMIADKVYKIIEKKISIEKDRRGLF